MEQQYIDIISEVASLLFGGIMLLVLVGVLFLPGVLIYISTQKHKEKGMDEGEIWNFRIKHVLFYHVYLLLLLIYTIQEDNTKGKDHEDD
jgi:predicted RND superfamily exporter protein